MAHMITNGYSLFKKRTVLCESLRVTTEKTGLDWFSRGPREFCFSKQHSHSTPRVTFLGVDLVITVRFLQVGRIL